MRYPKLNSAASLAHAQRTYDRIRAASAANVCPNRCGSLTVIDDLKRACAKCGYTSTKEPEKASDA